MRIAIGPGEVAGYFARLKAGFDELEVACEHFSLGAHSFGYAAQHHFLSGANAAATKLLGSSNAVARFAGRAARLLIKLVALLYAAARYDVFVFSGSETFLRLHDLKLLKLFGRKIVVIFLGTDARPPYLSGRHLDDEQAVASPARMLTEAQEMQRRIGIIERYADHIINHTATDQFFTRDYVRLAAIGCPIQIAMAAAPPTRRKRVRIVHAPSRPLAKGSDRFRRILDDLEREGLSFEYVELKGVPNSKVLEELAGCDFVLDELYSDAPMAMLATEAAMFGKPSVVGSFYAADFHLHNPDPQQPPSVFVRPEEVKAAVRRLIIDEAYRVDLGARAHSFIREHWAAPEVAQRILQVARGEAPVTWTARPARSGYIWGWGLSEAAWQAQVGQYVDHHGRAGLLVDHAPTLAHLIEQQLANGTGQRRCDGSVTPALACKPHEHR